MLNFIWAYIFIGLLVWVIQETWLRTAGAALLERVFVTAPHFTFAGLRRLHHVECVSLAAYFIIYSEIYSRARAFFIVYCVYISDVSVQISRLAEWTVLFGKWLSGFAFGPRASQKHRQRFQKLFMHIDVNFRGVPRNTSMLMPRWLKLCNVH